jgi:hypothetical protein
LGEIEFNGEDSAGNKQAYGVIHGSILSPTSTAEQGQLHFETATAGALTEKMIIGTTNLVINEIGAVFNVRIEGDTDANLFYTDATNSRVGVGLINPTEKLEVVGNIKLSGNVIPASGFGVDFAATSGTGTSELLADYEEGNWTPIDSSGAGLSLTVTSAIYTKIGRQVTCWANLAYPVTASVVTAVIGGLPFTSNASFGAGAIQGVFATRTFTISSNGLYGGSSVTTMNIDKNNGTAAATNLDLSASAMYFVVNYTV